MRRFSRQSWCAVLACIGTATVAHAAEHVTLRNGFDLICDHRVVDGEKVRLYMDAGSNYFEVNESEIIADEHVDLPQAPAATAPASPAAVVPEELTDADLQPILTKAGTAYNIDADLLASVIRAESAGHPRAVSRAGAQGLMQLMPATASDLGVADTFAPKQNIDGGTAYLDWLLKRYHENLQFALAAYNAGPAAVDRWHGIPPYRETRLYVARVIREYNRRYLLRHQADLRASAR
jgi:soluble lytic murein transglycosylase-like protein